MILCRSFIGVGDGVGMRGGAGCLRQLIDRGPRASKPRVTTPRNDTR